MGSFAINVGPRDRVFALIAGPHTPVFASPRATVRKPLHLARFAINKALFANRQHRNVISRSAWIKWRTAWQSGNPRAIRQNVGDWRAIRKREC